MEKRLSRAQNWAESVRHCLHRVVNWSYDLRNDSEKIDLEMVNKLLTFNPAPCNEPSHVKLKVLLKPGKLFFCAGAFSDSVKCLICVVINIQQDYAEEAKGLVEEINCSLSFCSEVFLETHISCFGIR